jgi:protein involved in polysaccharide export with SLBB domain
VLRYAGGVPVLPIRTAAARAHRPGQRAARFRRGLQARRQRPAKALRDGDIVTLLEISPQFANAVTLRGHVAQPLRYTYTPGMRIRDLIPDAAALISPDFYRRKNLLVQIIDEEDEELGASAAAS